MTTKIECSNNIVIEKKIISNGNSDINYKDNYFLKCKVSLQFKDNDYSINYDDYYFDIKRVPLPIHTCLSRMKLEEESEFLITSNDETVYFFNYELPQEYIFRCKVLKAVDVNDLAKLLDIVNEIKTQGNDCFKSSKLEQCYNYYNQCLQILYGVQTSNFSQEEIIKIEEAKITLHLNSAFCKRKLKHLNDAIEHCKIVFDSIAKSDESLAKAHFRLGEIYEESNYLDLSKYHYNKAALLKKDKTFYNAYDRICKKISELKI